MEITNANQKIENLSVDKVKKLITGNEESDVILLDVRQPEEYRSGHLPGAAFIPLPELIDRVRELDPAKPLLVYCRSGNRSRAAAAFLLSEGFSRVYSMEGGITAWNGQVAMGNYDGGLFLFKGRETTEELISLALVLEEGSRLFYSAIAELAAAAEEKNTFTALAAAEEKHKANIIEAYRVFTGENLPDDSVNKEPLRGVMESGIRIEDAVRFLRDKGKTLQDMLEVSMQVETNALDLYIKTSRQIEDAKAKKIFDILIEEEKQHLQRLGRLLGERASH